MSVPENKIMPAFYRAAPGVENDRRALNTFNGMQRVKKEGRYLGVALLIINMITEPEASLVRRAFEHIAKGKYAIDQVHKQVNTRGLKIGSAHFRNIVRKPVYCAEIEVPKYKNEEAYFADGQHEGIISEALYFKAQEY